jgi:signal transduction histidine kinase
VSATGSTANVADARRRWRNGSVRLRITVTATVIVLVVLTVSAALLVVSQRRALTEQLDDALEIEAERIAATVAADGVPPVGDDDDRLVVVVADGRVVAASDELEGSDADELARADDGAGTIDDEAVRVVRADAADEELGGVGDGEIDVEVVVAASTEDIDETVANLVRTLAVIVPVGSFVLALVVWILVGRTLRPVERIRAEVATIGLDELERRVPQPTGADEISRLASTMNEMLARLQSANQRQQRFVADAAHELRTPLTRLRADLEVGRGAGDLADAERLRLAALGDVVALQHLVDDLLLLARTDADAPLALRLVDLDDLVLDEALAAGDIDVRGVSAAQVVGDPSALRRVVRNLLDNARRHAASTVAVTLAEVDGCAQLVVDDDGPGIAAEHRVEVFRRFVRLDDARSPGAGRTGLGLAIVDAVVRQHGGSAAVDDSPLGGARLVVTIPLGPR